MALEITGKLIQIQPEVTGNGKNGTWVKQEFIIETTGEQYPKKVCMSAWGDKAQALKSFSPGSTVNVSFNIESREYNGKWYTDVRAWKITAGDNNAASPSPEVPEYFDPIPGAADAKDDLPF